MATRHIDPDEEIEALRRRLAELEAAQASASPTADTRGGAAVQGDAHAGRDFVQYITQIVQSGEDLEEAKSVVAHYLEVLAKDLAGLKQGEIDPSIDQMKRTPLQLADIYVNWVSL